MDLIKRRRPSKKRTIIHLFLIFKFIFLLEFVFTIISCCCCLLVFYCTHTLCCNIYTRLQADLHFPHLSSTKIFVLHFSLTFLSSFFITFPFDCLTTKYLVFYVLFNSFFYPNRQLLFHLMLLFFIFLLLHQRLCIQISLYSF